MQRKLVLDPLGVCYNNLRGCIRCHVICKMCGSEKCELAWCEISVKKKRGGGGGWGEGV